MIIAQRKHYFDYSVQERIKILNKWDDFEPRGQGGHKEAQGLFLFIDPFRAILGSIAAQYQSEKSH